MQKLGKSPPDSLSDTEVETVIALSNPWVFNLRLAMCTGCRWAELVRLERTDLTADGLLLIRKTKNGEPRTVPIPRNLLTEIMSRRGRLFVTRTGRPYSEFSNGAFNATIARKTGIDRFHVHMTRHTFACRYLEAGGELAMLQEVLGHSSVTTTQRYGRPNEKAIRADAARVFSAWEMPNREQYREHRENGAAAVPQEKR